MSKPVPTQTRATGATEGCRAQGPKAITLALLRQFARAYAPLSPSMPGIVLN